MANWCSGRGALVALAAGALARVAAAAPGEITTVAGGPGTGPALSVAQLPVAVAVSGSIVYIGDEGCNVVRRLDTTTGIETVAAGAGSQGFVASSGDGGPATAALMSTPDGVAVDAGGNL